MNIISAIHVFIFISTCVVRVATAKPASAVTVAHESLITPAPIVYDVDELHQAWPTSDAVPIGGQCGGPNWTRRNNCECPGKGIQLLLVLHCQPLRRYVHKHLLPGMDVFRMSLPLYESTLHNPDMHRHLLHRNIDIDFIRMGELWLVRVRIHDPSSTLPHYLLHRALPSGTPVRKYRHPGGYIPPGIVVPKLYLQAGAALQPCSVLWALLDRKPWVRLQRPMRDMSRLLMQAHNDGM